MVLCAELIMAYIVICELLYSATFVEFSVREVFHNYNGQRGYYFVFCSLHELVASIEYFRMFIHKPPVIRLHTRFDKKAL
jgi:hypothetical protein